MRHQRRKGVYVLITDKPAKALLNSILKAATTSDDNTYANSTVCMQSIEILKVAVEEGILVLPLDLERNCTGRELLDMIDLVGARLGCGEVDPFLNLESNLVTANYGPDYP